MAEDRIRLSQVVGVYGPGAMIDLPDRSVLVQGLDQWEMTGTGTFQIIEEPRLARLLHLRLSGPEDGRLAGDQPPQLRTPPIDANDPTRPSRAIRATVFPRWFVCDAIPGDRPHRRRLARFQDLEAPKYQEHKAEDGKKRQAVPIRFLCGCEDGHLQDIEWRRVVHQRRQEGTNAGACREQMWHEDSGTSADPRDTRIICECGASISLEELFQAGALGNCRGERPWIDDVDPKGCDKRLRLLIRSATNTYFPQVARVISLPASADDLARLIDENWTVLDRCQSAADIGMARRFNPPLDANLKGFSDEEVFARLRSPVIDGSPADAVTDPKLAEFELLASGRALIGSNDRAAKLHAETLDRQVWDPAGAAALKGIHSVVAVHRLREVACLYGFTRFEPAPLENDELEDVGLAVEGAPLALHPEWLPAVEQFGEGFFVLFAPEAISAWLARPLVRERARGLRGGADAWLAAKRDGGAAMRPTALDDHVRPEHVMAHSFAHALMEEVALDCGYPSSSIKERVYALPAAPGEPRRCGVLIYTATAGNQGTLGGLVEVTRRFDRVVAAALERQRLCSSDPVCADHDPMSVSDDRALHGAACHGCLLIAETSCEARNLYLDRALLVSTVATPSAGFFD